jgi:hypothetical protein
LNLYRPYRSVASKRYYITTVPIEPNGFVRPLHFALLVLWHCLYYGTGVCSSEQRQHDLWSRDEPEGDNQEKQYVSRSLDFF